MYALFSVELTKQASVAMMQAVAGVAVAAVVAEHVEESADLPLADEGEFLYQVY